MGYLEYATQIGISPSGAMVRKATTEVSSKLRNSALTLVIPVSVAIAPMPVAVNTVQLA